MRPPTHLDNKVQALHDHVLETTAALPLDDARLHALRLRMDKRRNPLIEDDEPPHSDVVVVH